MMKKLAKATGIIVASLVVLFVLASVIENCDSTPGTMSDAQRKQMEYEKLDREVRPNRLEAAVEDFNAAMSSISRKESYLRK